jgi:hypothetical protein
MLSFRDWAMLRYNWSWEELCGELYVVEEKNEHLTFLLESAKLEIEQLKKKEDESQTSYRHRDESFSHDHLASSNS